MTQSTEQSDARALAAMLSSRSYRAPALVALASAFAQSGGNATHAAVLLGMSHRTLRRLCANHPALQEALEAHRAVRQEQDAALAE